MKRYNLLLNKSKGNYKVLTVKAPFNEAILGEVEIADEAVIEGVLEKASTLFLNKKSWLKPYTRIAILEKTASLLKDNLEDLVRLSAAEGGKPYRDSYVEGERCIDSFRSAAERLRSQHGEEIPMNITESSAHRLAITSYQPRGVVIALSAFNHPMNLVAHQLAPAIASACPVIIKPAEATPLSCFRIVQLLYEAGLPREYCQCLITNDHGLTAKLVEDTRIGFLSFIGSAKVGWMLRSKLKPGVTCALEHGGAAPAILAKDAHLNSAVPAICKGGFYHAGQVCVSVQRVFFHENLAEDLIPRLQQSTEALQLGDPLLKETEVGPLIRHSEVDRVGAWVHEAIADGAKLITGAKKISDSLYQPSILLNPPQRSKISRLEIFGPVIALYSYKDISDAITLANSLPYAFQAAAFTQDISILLRLYKELDTACLMANDHSAFRVDWMPFQGIKESGLGTGGIHHSMEDMQIKKMLVIKDENL